MNTDVAIYPSASRKSPNAIGSPIRRILVPVDLTARSEEALRYAIAWAESFGSDLHVLHVAPGIGASTCLEGIPGPHTTSDDELHDRRMRTAIDHLINCLPFPAERVCAAVRTGHPPTQIVAYGREHDIDLILMGSQAHHALARVALGTVSEEVVSVASCPVLTVPPHVTMPRWLGAARTVLIPTDLTDASNMAFAYARALARTLGAALRVIHVVVPPWERQLTYLPPPAVVEQLTGTRAEHAHSLDAPGDDVASTIRVGQVYPTLTAYADEVQADLIVMAIHGRGLLSHVAHGLLSNMAFGSVTHRLLRQARCPVLTLRPGGRQDPDDSRPR